MQAACRVRRDCCALSRLLAKGATCCAYVVRYGECACERPHFVLFLAAPATQAGLPPNNHLDADARREEDLRVYGSARPAELRRWSVFRTGDGAVAVRSNIPNYGVTIVGDGC